MTVFKDRYMQYIAAFSASILTLETGYSTAWPSPILEKLESADSPIGVITLEQKSWISSTLLLGVLVGNMFLGPLQDICGRRGLLLISTVPLLACWLLILFADSFPLLVSARFLLGLGTVVPTMTSAVYISEITDPDIRGKLGMANLLMVEAGMVFVTAVGSYSTYNAAAIAGAVVPIVFGLVFFHMPESPYFYLRKNDIDSATKSLTRLRPQKCIQKEIIEMQNNVEKEMKNKGTLWEVIISPLYRKALIIGIGLKTLQQFSGTIAINNYMKTIFNQVDNGLDPREASVICTSVSIFGVFLGSHIIDKMGRKPLLYISTLGCTIALTIEYIYFFLQDNLNYNLSNYGMIPFAGIIIFNTSKALGIQTVPYVLLSEIFPTNAKGWGIVICMVYSSFVAFLITLLFPYVVEAWGISYCFLIFIVFCVFGLLFIIFVVPETKGQSLHSIQDKFEAELI